MGLRFVRIEDPAAATAEVFRKPRREESDGLFDIYENSKLFRRDGLTEEICRTFSRRCRTELFRKEPVGENSNSKMTSRLGRNIINQDDQILLFRIVDRKSIAPETQQ
jgi:hypothetical protein